MQLLRIIAFVSLSLNGVIAVPGLYNTPTSPEWPSPTCSTTCSTYCPTTSSSPPTASPTAVNIINQNICQSGSPFCCALSSTNDDNGSGHSCNEMGNSTFSCDSTVVCCNNNGGNQICTNSLTIVIPFDLGNLLGDI